MWASEENRQLKELRERLGMAARLDNNIEHLGSSTSCRSASGHSATSETYQFDVGHRVRVVRGRRFHDFGAGDAGTVLRVDTDGNVCTVAFDDRPEPLQVAMRHLEPEPARKQPRNVSGSAEPAGQPTGNSVSQDHAGSEAVQETRAETLSRGDGLLCAAALKAGSDTSSPSASPKPGGLRKGAAALLRGFKTGEVGRIVDDMESRDQVEAGTAVASSPSSVGALDPRPALGATGETPSLTLVPGESDLRRFRNFGMVESGTGSSASSMRRAVSQPPGDQQRVLETVPGTSILGSPPRTAEVLWRADTNSPASNQQAFSLLGVNPSPFRTHSGPSLGISVSSAMLPGTLPPAPSRLGETSMHTEPAESSMMQTAAGPSSQKAAERSAERSTERQDPLRTETAELRRVAEVAAAAEYRREAALFIEQHGANAAAREEAEALADAVQASAHATATATAAAMVEVASLRVEVSELQTKISKEAEQRTTSLREIERAFEQLRAKQERGSADAEEAIKAEQKRLSRKQAELVSLCLSLQKDQQQELQAGNATDAAIDWEHWEQRFATLDRGLEVAMRSQERAAEQLRSLEEFSTSSRQEFRQFEERAAALEAGATALNTVLSTLDTLDRSRADELGAREEIVSRLDQSEKRLVELEKHLAEVDSAVQIGAERLEAMSSRADALAAGMALKADREASPAAAGRIDSLASRIDSLVMDLAAKAERETPTAALASVHVVEALTARFDRLTETLGAEVARVESLHRDGMQENAAAVANAAYAAEQREAEQLRRLGAEAERHAAELRDATAEVECRASEAIKIGQRAREALEAHCEITNDANNAVEALRSRIESVCEGLAVEARLREDGLTAEANIREEAIQRVEDQCRQAREDAANAAPAAAAAATSAAGVNASAMERQLKAVLTEVRSDADRAETGRREEKQRRQEAELALQRLRGELDVLREELNRRSIPVPMEVVPNTEALPSGTLRAAAALPAPEAAPPTTPKAINIATPPAAAPRVMRYSSGSTKERPQLSTADVFRWPSPPQQARSPPREKTAVPVVVESRLSPNHQRPTSGNTSAPEPLARWGAPAAANTSSTFALTRAQGTPRTSTPPQQGRALALPAAPAAAAAASTSADEKPTAVPATKCSFCGNIFMVDAVFCRRCGAKRGTVEPIPSAPQTSSAGTAPSSAQQPRQAVLRAASAGTLRTQATPSAVLSAAVMPPPIVTLAAPSWPSAPASGRTLSPTTEPPASSATISMSMESNTTAVTAQLDEVVS